MFDELNEINNNDSPSRPGVTYFFFEDDDLVDLKIDNNDGNNKIPLVTIPALKVSRFGKTA